MNIRFLIGFLGICFFAITAKGQDDIYALDHIVNIEIDFEEENWHELLDSLKESGTDGRLIADVKVDGVAYPQTGIRYKGNSSYFNVRNEGLRKLPFNIKVNFKNKKQKLPGGFSTLKLSNVFRDPSFMREVLSYEIANKYMPSPRANFSKITINGDYIGLYNLTESVDDDLLEKFYGDEDGVLMKCDPNWHIESYSHCPEGDKASLQFLGRDSVCYYALYELKSKNGGWARFIDLIHEINTAPEDLHQVMDVDETLWMLAFNNVVVNLDSYLGRLCHNYYFYQDESNIWHPVLWDMNLSFGGFRYTGIGPPLSNEKMQEMSMFLHYKENNEKRPLVLKLLSNNHYRKIYLAHIKTILEENFANGWYKERAEEIRGMIREEVVADPNKLYDQVSFDSSMVKTIRIGNSSIIGIEELMEKRTEFLMNHPLILKEQPTVADVEATKADDAVVLTAKATDIQTLYVYYRSDDYTPWRRTIMEQGEDGQGWQVSFAEKDILHYYLIAENSSAAKAFPARASNDFYTVE